MTQRAPIYTRIGPRARPVDLLTWTQSPQVPPAAAVQRPFNQFDWPNPRARARASDLGFWCDGLPQSALSLTIPRRQSEWPNPIVARQPQRSWVQPPQIVDTVVYDLQFFVTETGMMPAPAKRSDILGWIGPRPPIATVVVQSPLNQYDWQNPQLRRSSNDLRTWIDGLPQTALSLTLPQRQTEWPNPAPQKRNLELGTWIATPAVPPVVLYPFNQSDWPNPSPPKPNLELRSWTYWSQIPEPIQYPFGQTDWPNPLPQKANLELRTWANGLPESALGLTLPIRQTEWPVPRGFRPIQLADSGPNATLLLSLVLILVPDVVGDEQAAGTAILEGDGFVVAVQPAYSDTVPAGTIIGQDPIGGSFAPQGATVTIVVSLGPEPTENIGGHYWPKKHHKPKDYRAELDEKQAADREELHKLLREAAGLLEQAPATETAKTLRSEINGLGAYVETFEPALDEPKFDLEAHRQAVQQTIARTADYLIVRVAQMLDELIQEIIEDSNE